MAVCKKELNRQLQALHARVGQLEKHVAAIADTQFEDILQTMKALLADVFGTPPVYEGIIMYMANQKLMDICFAMLGDAGSALQDMLDDLPSPEADLGALTPDLDNIMDIYKNLVQAMIEGTTLPKLSWEIIMFQLMSTLLSVPQYAESLTSGLLDSAESAVADARAALNLDPLNKDLQETYKASLLAVANIENVADAANRVMNCKTASLLLGGSGD